MTTPKTSTTKTAKPTRRASPAATQAPPVTGRSGHGAGKPTPAAPSIPDTNPARRTIVRGILASVPRAERAALTGAVYRLATAPTAEGREAAQYDCRDSGHPYAAAAILGAYGVAAGYVGEIVEPPPPALDTSTAEALAFDLVAAVAAMDASSASPRVLRCVVAPPDDIDALLAAVGEEVERGANGALGIALATATRVARGRISTNDAVGDRDDALANAFAWLLVELRRDVRDRTRMYRGDYHRVACAVNNDDAETIARQRATLRTARRDLVRVAALAGRIAAAVTAAEGATA